MRKLLNKPWFVGLLAIGAIFFVAQSLFNSGPKRRAAVSVQNDAALPPGDGEEHSVEVPRAATLREALLALKLPARITDPFGTRVAPVSAATDEPAARLPDIVDTVRLSAIWLQRGELLLLVNEHICRIGDSFGGLKIDSAALDGI